MTTVAAELDALADPAVAEGLLRYFQVWRGGYGEGDVFLGVRVGDLRRVVKPHLRRPYECAEWLPLLASPVHEHRAAALLVMAGRAQRGPDDERGQIYADYLGHTDRVNNWDLVDLSCGPIVAGHLAGRDRSPLRMLARSPLLWERRIAIVATQHFLLAGETDDLFAVAEILLGDGHELIHKAVGWSLREAGRRVSGDALRGFLDRFAATMPRTALRYAVEHLDEPERRRYMALRPSRRDA